MVVFRFDTVGFTIACDELGCRNAFGADGFAILSNVDSMTGEYDPDRRHWVDGDIRFACTAHLDDVLRQEELTVETAAIVPFGDFWCRIAESAGLDVAPMEPTLADVAQIARLSTVWDTVDPDHTLTAGEVAKRAVAAGLVDRAELAGFLPETDD
jgi:hypothetical protein